MACFFSLMNNSFLQVAFTKIIQFSLLWHLHTAFVSLSHVFWDKKNNQKVNLSKVWVSQFTWPSFNRSEIASTTELKYWASKFLLCGGRFLYVSLKLFIEVERTNVKLFELRLLIVTLIGNYQELNVWSEIHSVASPKAYTYNTDVNIIHFNRGYYHNVLLHVRCADIWLHQLIHQCFYVGQVRD